MLERVARNGWALKHATEELRGDREVVITAVADRGYALEYATNELRGDREVVMTAGRQQGGMPLNMLPMSLEETVRS